MRSVVLGIILATPLIVGCRTAKVVFTDTSVAEDTGLASLDTSDAAGPDTGDAPGPDTGEAAGPDTGDAPEVDTAEVLEVDTGEPLEVEDNDGDGYTVDDGDCDDENADVHPDAEEICDGIDNDCDDDIDDDDSGLTDASTWYIDYDNDDYGSDSYTLDACEQPSGYVANNTDCDDTEDQASPGQTEVCDGIDNDCDGDVDEDDADDASTWYRDADEDGFGDTAHPTNACDQPSGYVSDDTDCDDDDATIYPDAPERYDAMDNDCDGDVDEDLWMGSGADGDLEVTDETDLSDEHAPWWWVSAIDGAEITTGDDAGDLGPGDEVLIINVQGSETYYEAVGTYEFGTVSTVSGDLVTLDKAVGETYGESDNSDLTDQSIVLQRVPHFEDVFVFDSGTLQNSSWEDGGTGIVAFRATGEVWIERGGLIQASAAGYTGGPTGSLDNCDAFQGESYAGLGDGDGDGSCVSYNEDWGHWAANYGGGGAHITGGGGAYDDGAELGDSWTGGGATPPFAGEHYGEEDLSLMFYGSGGGGVWNDGTYSRTSPGPGGNGGGILYIGADTITTEAEQAIACDGGTTEHWAQGTWNYGAGGGAGGSIFLLADTVDLYEGSVSAMGGEGQKDYTRDGGSGGFGRVRIDCSTCNGSAHGTLRATAALISMSSPEPEHSEAPE